MYKTVWFYYLIAFGEERKLESSSYHALFFSLRFFKPQMSKYSHKHPVLKSPQSVFSFWRERLGFTPIQKADVTIILYYVISRDDEVYRNIH